MKLIICMLFILSISVADAQICNYTAPASQNSKNINGLILEGANEILMPDISLNMPDGNWTYPFDYYPIFAQNQTISGTFFSTSELGGSLAGIGMARINTSSILETLRVLAGPADLDRMEIVRAAPLLLNDTGDGNFSLPGLPAGIYAFFIANLSSLTVMSTLPILIAEENISVDAPDKLSLGDILEVNIKAANDSANASRKFGAALIKKRDYLNSSLLMNVNWSEESLVSRVNIADESVILSGEPKISQELLEDIFPILPQDSAFALDESNQTYSEMFMITDSYWEPGEYILTCAIYSSHELKGIRQKTIELIS